MTSTQTLPNPATIVSGDVEIDLGTIVAGDAQAFQDEVLGILDPDAELDEDAAVMIVWRIVDFTKRTVILEVAVNGLGL